MFKKLSKSSTTTTTTAPVFGATLDPSAMALMTDGEIPLTDSTNLLGPNSLMPVTSYLNYGAATTSAPDRPVAVAAAAASSSYAGPPITQADLQRFRNSGRKKSRHKRGGGCTNSYSNNSFDYSHMESNYAGGGGGGGNSTTTTSVTTTGMYRDSFRPSQSSTTTTFGRERTTSGRTHKNTRRLETR